MQIANAHSITSLSSAASPRGRRRPERVLAAGTGDARREPTPSVHRTLAPAWGAA